MNILPIRTDKTYRASLERAADLMSKTDKRSLDELEILQALIERWERSQYQLPAPNPVEAIRFRMSQLGLTSRDLEPFIGSRARVSEVLTGSRSLSIDMIRALAHHLGIPAASLIGDVSKPAGPKRAEPSKPAVEKLRSFGVLRPRETVSQFIDRVFPAAAQPALLRKTRTTRTNAKTDPAALEAWCAAVVVKADAVDVAHDRGPVQDGWAQDLARLSVHEDGPKRVSSTLAEMGVAFVTLDHLPGTYLDGAVMCRTDGRPVIALTLRYDRLDNFWFTLLHEFCHAARHLDAERRVIIDDLELKTSDDIEEEADRFAQDTLIPPKIWKKHASPDFEPSDVLKVAEQAKVHPSVVAGRWQREHKDYRRFSKLLGRGEVRAQFGGE